MDLQEEIDALAARAVNLGRDQFHLELDYSPQSLALLDAILSDFRRSIRFRWLLWLVGNGISKEQIWKMAFLWGAYLGVVMQRNAGGTWTLEKREGQEGVVALGRGETKSYPVEIVHQRLTGQRAPAPAAIYEEFSSAQRRSSASRR